MWYDKYPGLPPRSSPLESLFLLVFLQRTESELLSTRALVQTSMPEGSAAKPAIEAYQKYVDTMFPFIESASKESEVHALLREFVKHPVKIDLRPIREAQAQTARNNAVLRHNRLKAHVPGVSPTPVLGKKP